LSVFYRNFVGLARHGRLWTLAGYAARSSNHVLQTVVRGSTSDNHALILGVFAAMVHPCASFGGSNLLSTFTITKGWCSPTLPTKGYNPQIHSVPRSSFPNCRFRENRRSTPANLPALVQMMFDQRPNFSPDAGITCITQFEQHSHVSLFY
jgi:hypothetical protein